MQMVEQKTKKIVNPAIGEIEYAEDQIIRFEEGMLGLPSLKSYLLMESPNIAPFLRLQCIDEPNISFLLIDPAHVDPGYHQYVSSRQGVGEYYDAEDNQSALFAVVKISNDGEDITANLVAPVTVNLNQKIGFQLVLLESPYSVRHSLTAQQDERKEA